MNRREVLAVLAAAIAYRPPAPDNAGRPDYISYWLFEFDEKAERGFIDEAIKGAYELRAAIKAEGVPKPWRTAYIALQRLSITKGCALGYS